MAIVKENLSDAQCNALAAIGQHGYIVKARGSFLRTPHGTQIQSRTFGSLYLKAQRGHLSSKVGIVRQGLLDVPAIIRPDLPDLIDLTPVPIDTPSFDQSPDLARITWQGYKVSMYRSPNSGDMVFDIETPEDFGDQIDIYVNDTGVDLP